MPLRRSLLLGIVCGTALWFTRGTLDIYVSPNGLARAALLPSPPAPLEPDDAFGRPTPRTTQAVKTLKCQECGTFNYPTEWYCERCGGELAAL
jgi:hypothetical protein